LTRTYTIGPSRDARLGANFDGEGVNFAVFSDNAERITLCLYDENNAETHRIDLPERDGGVWHGYVPGLCPGQRYGYRAHGPYRPEEGHRFNPNKLLIDPYAKRLTGYPRWSDKLMGYTVGSKDDDLSFDTRDSGPDMTKCIVVDPTFSWSPEPSPRTPMAESVIYEAHVKGLTRLHPGVSVPGTYLGLASDTMLDHLTRLRITAVELLPVHAFLNDRFLRERNLTNYWGYQTLGYFAPDSRYLSSDGIAEFQIMVARLHAAGIEVILDVVYNHTCEGNQWGPTLAFRGLDNASYYRLRRDDPRYYDDDTGTGNTLNLDHPMVLRMVMDSLRYWVEVMHVDGFRFDLCSTLGRTPSGFDQGAAFFDALRQDPVLSEVKLIAEPWDVGPGGYQLGAFPPPFSEWNDKFRDGVRRFWRGDEGQVPELADRLTGSASQFDHSGRPASSSVNFVTCHDGFTLDDLVSYNTKHNEKNKEQNRDGHSENFSDNMGVEGPTSDPNILAARGRRKRNMLATLFFSQGTPMLLAGDEIGHTQQGNNNAYCQDNETSWLDWGNADAELLEFTRSLIAFRKAHPILRQKLFMHSKPRRTDGIADLFWHRVEGGAMQQADWDDARQKCLVAELRTARGTPVYAAREDAILLIFNAGPEQRINLPKTPEGQVWVRHIDTCRPTTVPDPMRENHMAVPECCVVAMVLEPER